MAFTIGALGCIGCVAFSALVGLWQDAHHIPDIVSSGALRARERPIRTR